MPPTDNQAGKPAADPLEGLAKGIESQAPAQVLTPDEQRAAEEGAQQLAKMMAGIETFTGKLLTAVRARIAIKLPEIRDHWTDKDMAGLAAAVPPVVQKRLGMLAPLMGAYPEECMLLVAAVPLAMGYMSAVSDHADKGGKALPAPAAVVPAAGAAAGLEHPMAQALP